MHFFRLDFGKFGILNLGSRLVKEKQASLQLSTSTTTFYFYQTPSLEIYNTLFSNNSNMNQVSLSLEILLNSLFWMVIQSNNVVTDFGIATSDAIWADCNAIIELTLLYDSIIYQCNVVPNQLSTEFPCSGSASFVRSDCTGVYTQEMFIKNTDYNEVQIDAVKIGYIFITDSNGNKQTVNTNSVCLDKLDCGSNTALVNIDTSSVDTSVTSYSYSCSSVIITFHLVRFCE